MKKLITIAVFVLVAVSAHAQAKIKFDTKEIDYGKIAYGSEGTKVFTFTNTGDAPLVIKDVKSTCGCTVAKKPTHEIAPGKKGEIEVKYDTKREGPIRRVVTVYSTAPDSPAIGLKIKGFVMKKNTKSILEK